MGLSEMLTGWEKYKAHGFTGSFTKVNEQGTKQAWVRSLEHPGEWAVTWMDLATKETFESEIFLSLIQAIHFAGRQIEC